MAPEKKIRDKPPLSNTHPGTPPNSLGPSSSDSAISQDAEQALNPDCPCSSQRGNPAVQSSSTPLTLENIEQLFLKLIEATSKSPDSAKASEAVKPGAGDDKAEPVRASKLEFKTVNEIWDRKAHKYKVVESLKPLDEIEELDQYVFVVRVKVDRNTEERTSYIDIKSEVLRDILRKVLKDVYGISLREDKPTIEANLLYHYLPELESHRSNLNDDSPDDSIDNSPNYSTNSDSLDATRIEHLDLLINHIKTFYLPATHSLISLLKGKEATYDLLWALFKPGDLVYTTCFGTHKPRCVIFDSGEEKTSKSEVKYYNIECRYLDFDGGVFGEVFIHLVIPKFHGTKRINTLQAFPLQYHSDESGVRADLLECGRKFVSLMGAYHRRCCGKAFFMHEGDAIEFHVNSRIMIDAAFFRKQNPNYSRPRIIEPMDSELELATDGIFMFKAVSEPDDQVQSNSKGPEELKENELLTCCLTVPGFSFNDKIWAEFAVADIEDIEWSESLFNCLSIPDEHKDALMALAETHIGRTQCETQTGEVQSVPFDDFVTGKGRGLTVLLQPPGVGKTLTAEAISEHLKRPLYSISAGELDITAAELERQLSCIFEIARHWRALLLLDEADVYLEQRTAQDLTRNGLVSVFLRKLEYCEGIIFLTTNRVSQFDVAILSRVHLMLKYDDLSKEDGRKIWEHFVERAGIAQGKIKADELNCLVNNKLNGRQIKNAMATALALARKQMILVCYSHLQTAVDAITKFISEFNGGTEAAGLYR